MIPPQPPQQGSDLKLEGLTRDQIKKIQKSMKKPEFIGLLNEYMIQISDPKNKTEYDQYLKQMERQGQLPKNMKLVKLKPEFCLRTQIISQRNKKHQMKFFINMCSTEFIDKPSCQPGKTKDGSAGYNWRVPNSLGKIRYDQDKHKNPCQVIDCGFHPDTFVFSNQNTAFQAMIISIALEGAERQLGERKQTLSKDYIILKNVKCKGQNGEPALLPIRYIDGKAYNRGQGPTQPQRNTEGKQTKLQKQINQQKQKYETQKTKEQIQKQKKQQQQQKQQDLQQGNQNKKLIQDLETGIRAPKFTSIYTYVTDYSDFIEGASKKLRTLPNSFTVQFKVPRMENISQANTLQINQKKIILAVKDKYYIDISFEDMKIKNYPLKYSQAKAKFDKKKKTLRVQIPVDVSSIPQHQLPEFQNTKQKQKQNEQQQKKVVENELWKNKVLEIPEQKNVEKFISQADIEQDKKKNQAKKLVEQIDEDDFVQDQQIVEKHQKINEQADENQPSSSQMKIFKISDYYQKTQYPNFDPKTVPQSLSFKFKQNEKHIYIIIYMRNCEKSQVKHAFKKSNGQLVIVWLHKQPNYLHISLSQKYMNKVEKIQLLERVNFYTVVIDKKIGQKQQKIWGEGSIKARNNNQKMTIQNYYQLINRFNAETEQLQRRLQQQKKDQIVQNNQSSQKAQDGQSAKNGTNSSQPMKQFQSVDENIKKQRQRTNQKIENGVKSIGKVEDSSSVFQKLPIQFIKFNLEFIQAIF